MSKEKKINGQPQLSDHAEYNISLALGAMFGLSHAIVESDVEIPMSKEERREAIKKITLDYFDKHRTIRTRFNPNITWWDEECHVFTKKQIEKFIMTSKEAEFVVAMAEEINNEVLDDPS